VYEPKVASTSELNSSIAVRNTLVILSEAKDLCILSAASILLATP